MSRIFAYVLIFGLFGVGIFATIEAVKVEEPKKSYQFVTRSPVDSITAENHLRVAGQNKPDQSNPIKWNEITAAIVAIFAAGAGVGFKQFKSEVYRRFKNIDEQLHTVADQRNRDSIDQRLTNIEGDAAGFADDERVKALIEGIGGRTRSFCRDVMQMDFTDECLEKAIMKMNARVQDGKHQVKDLGFSDYFAEEVNKIRCDALKQLRVDLTRLVADRLHNSKYERFGEIICRFQKGYMKAVIRLGNETKQA